ncbi:MAG: hypothetical protein P8K80_11080 [Phycisphaerales bacterium]|nr:hypothetical protein [Phycisphaerales bacterium]
MAATMMIGETSDAATRRVLLEQVTATWCGPCQSVGRAAIDLLEDYPDSITGYQCHGDDSYTISWGNSRMSFYGVTGYPTVWQDGWNQQYGSYGSDSANYSNLQSMMNACLNRTTDVVIQSTGVETANNLYEVTYDIAVEATGTARTMKFHAIQVLNYYPSGTHYYNCLIQGNTAPTITLQPGESTQIVQTFVLSGASLSDKENVSYIAWLQSTASGPPAQVYNSDQHGHGQQPPSTVSVPGDYATITAAINDVGQYSTINIGPGIYYELINPEGKKVTLLGVDGADATIIDGSESGTVVTLMSGENETMVLDGLTIQNGYSSITGGIKCNGNPTIMNCIIRDNHADYVVGGLSSASEPGPTISGTRFCGNDIADIYGYYVDGGGNSFEETCDNNPVCPGDYDDNYQVNVNDLLTVIQEWGNPYTVDDLLTVIANWGTNCL